MYHRNVLFILVLVAVTALVGSATARAERVDAADVFSREELADMAASTVETYFSALASGDVATVETLLGGAFRARRLHVLHSDGYDRELKRVYSGSTIAVDDVVIGDVSGAVVSGQLTMASGEHVSVSLTLALAIDPSGYVYHVIGERTTGRL